MTAAMPEAIALILGSIGMDREVERAAAIQPFWPSRALGTNLLLILEQQKQLLRAQWRRDEAEAGVGASRVLQHANTDVKPLVIGGDGRPALSR